MCIQIEIIPNKYVDYKYQVVCIDLSQNNRLSTNTRTLRSIRKFRNDVVNKNNYRNNIKKLDDVIVQLSEREATNKLADVNCQDNILEPLSLGNLDIRFTNQSLILPDSNLLLAQDENHDWNMLVNDLLGMTAQVKELQKLLNVVSFNEHYKINFLNRNFGKNLLNGNLPELFTVLLAILCAISTILCLCCCWRDGCKEFLGNLFKLTCNHDSLIYKCIICLLFINDTELPRETVTECIETQPVSTSNAHIMPAANYFLLQPPMRQHNIRIGDNSFPSIEEM